MNIPAPLVSLFLRCCGSLPIPLRAFLGKTAGSLFSFLPTRDRSIARCQMDLFISDQGGSRHLMGVYASLGQSTLESMNIRPFKRNIDRYVHCPNFDEAAELFRRQKGMLTLTAHTGNWDLMAAYVVEKGLPLSTIGTPARDPALQKVLSSIRDEYGIRTIWKGRGSVIEQIVSEMTSGRVVAGLIDQDTKVKSIPIPFFGREAQTPCVLVDLALTHNVPIVSAFMVRTGFLRYEIRVAPLATNGGIAAVLEEYHRRLEGVIREYPEQWVWFHKRWRTDRNGKRRRSQEYLNDLRKELAQ